MTKIYWQINFNIIKTYLIYRTLHSYNATNLNEMSFKAGDILHITDTRYNFDEQAMTWTWYGARKVSSSKQTEGEIPAIEGYVNFNMLGQLNCRFINKGQKPKFPIQRNFSFMWEFKGLTFVDYRFKNGLTENNFLALLIT